MRRSIVALSLFTMAGAAHAQSSVTLYGVVGGGVRWTNGTKGGSIVQFATPETQNRFGIRTVEDIGDGMSVLAVLENTYQTGTGALGRAGTLFDTAAYVGFTGRFGRLTFGRQLNVAEDLIVDLDPDHVGGSIAAITPNAITGTNVFTGDTRFNNMVKYKGKFGGFGIGASYSMGGVAGNTRAGSNYAVAATYQTGPVFGGASYQRTYSADATQMAQFYQVGGYWQVGPARIALSYLQLMIGGSPTLGSQRRDSVPQGGVSWQVTPELVVTAAFYDDIANNLGNVRGASGHKTTEYAIVDYFLSKRTNLYFEIDRNAFSGAYRSDPVNLAAFARAPSSSGVTGITVGMTSRF